MSPARRVHLVGGPGYRGGMRAVPVPAEDSSADHFWWRPGWAPGRSYLTWHVVVSDDPAAVTQIGRLRDSLRGLSSYQPVEDEVLHLTGPGVGFADDIPQSAREAVTGRVRLACAKLAPVVVQLNRPWVAPSGIGVTADDVGTAWLAELRLLVRRETAAAGLDVPGDDDEDYRPHVTLAYGTGKGSTAAAHGALSRVWTGGATLRVSGLTLLGLRMAPPRYEWDVIARVALAAGGATGEP